MDKFERVGVRLGDWAIQVRDARADAIAELTKEVIREISGSQYFDLPKRFLNYIEDYERREGALQTIADYRDHFIHPFHVFSLGYCILNRWKEYVKEDNIQKMPLHLSEKQDLDYNLKLWFVCSIYHDVGYPAEKLERLIYDFFETTIGHKLGYHFDWSSVLLAGNNLEHIDEISKLFSKKHKGEKNNEINFKKWINKRLLEEHDHGVLSSLMLLNQGWEKTDELEMAHEAALAIALHSYRRRPVIENKEGHDGRGSGIDLGELCVEDFPLAFFLYYCDNAQEWGRNVLLKSKQFNGPRYKLKTPVPLISMDQGKIKTEVVIWYPISPSAKVNKDKTLGELFNSIAKDFISTWYLRNQSEHDFWIRGELGKENVHLGMIRPAPFCNLREDIV